MNAGVNTYFHNMIISFRDQGPLKIDVVPRRLQLQRLWLLQEAPAQDWQASCRWSRPSVCPLWGLCVPRRCFSQSSLQQQFSFKTEEITGINQIGAEFIWGVAGCFVMQTTELQNNRFSFLECRCCPTLHSWVVRTSLVVLAKHQKKYIFIYYFSR